MSTSRNPVWASARRVRDAQERVDRLRELAFEVRDDREQHERAVNVLFLLEDTLFEMTIAHEMLLRLPPDET